MPIPKKVADRLATGLKRFKPVLEAAKDRDVKDSPVNGTFATVVRSVSCMWAQAGR